MDELSREGIITNIQQFSTHDGPGIRTVVFLKGCPLRCAWCCNPETQYPDREMGFSPGKCPPDCHACLSSCPERALSCVDGKITLERERCRTCAALKDGNPPCVDACVHDAFVPYGKRKTVGDILDIVEKDALFYRYEQGGMTLSGGEALFQPEFALALLRGARSRFLHTCMETCGYVSQEALREACRFLDYLIFDVKSSDAGKHRQATGRDNARILENLRMVRREFPHLPVKVRTPVIPRFNDTEQDIEAIALFLKELGIEEYELLPYHAYGTSKAVSLGRRVMEAPVPTEETMTRLKERAFTVLRT